MTIQSGAAAVETIVPCDESPKYVSEPTLETAVAHENDREEAHIKAPGESDSLAIASDLTLDESDTSWTLETLSLDCNGAGRFQEQPVAKRYGSQPTVEIAPSFPSDNSPCDDASDRTLNKPSELAESDEKVMKPAQPTVDSELPSPPVDGPLRAMEQIKSVRDERDLVRLDISAYSGREAQYPSGALPQLYLRWNKILFTKFIANATDEKIHLVVSPRSLAMALFDDTSDQLSPVEAERLFIYAVREVYRNNVVGSSARLRILRRLEPTDGTPLCVAFLALSVLAAHNMRTDQEAASGAYYIRLACLLDVEQLAGNLPKDFRTEEFASLWGFLADWVAKNKGLSLVLPQEDIQKRYVAYPLAHVPLRQLDLEKLPGFFDWAGYSPGALISAERVAADIKTWGQSYGFLSDAGKSALHDERLPAVVAQVRSELQAWDGSVSEVQGIRHVRVEVLLETVGRRSKLFLLAPHPEGYPQIFRTGEVELIGGESWYDPLELSEEDGDLLSKGFSWLSEDDTKCTVTRSGAKAIVLAPAEYSGFVSTSQIPKGTYCAVICHESWVDAVGAYLAEICDSSIRAVQLAGFPREWRAFLKVRAVRRSNRTPDELGTLEVASEAKIIPQGGLRLGLQWAWMEGAPPRLLIEGHEGRVVCVDDKPVQLDEDGFLETAELFSQSGTYTVRVGSLEKKVRIVRPTLRPSPPGSGPGEDRPGTRHAVLLPLGSWVVIGPHPSEVLSIRAAGPRQSLVFCDFEPAWAIKVGAGRGATVVRIATLPVVRSGKSSKSPNAQRWASAIYEAAIRHPAFESQADDSAGTAQTWAAYVEEVKQLKRYWKKGAR